MIVILFNDENQKYDHKQFEFIIRWRKNRKQSLTIWAIKNAAFPPLRWRLLFLIRLFWCITLTSSTIFVTSFIRCVCSNICFIVLYYHLSNWTRRQSLHNHTLILLLCIILWMVLIDIPVYLNTIRLGPVWPEYSITCYIWWFFNMALSVTSNTLIGFAVIEKPISIFHNQWISSEKTNVYFHIIFFI
jgi:hypothetical protein